MRYEENSLLTSSVHQEETVFGRVSRWRQIETEVTLTLNWQRFNIIVLPRLLSQQPAI